MATDSHQDDLDLDGLSAHDLEQCGLSLDDVRQLNEPADDDTKPSDNSDLIAELRAINSGSDFDEDGLHLSGDDNVELPSDVDCSSNVGSPIAAYISDADEIPFEGNDEESKPLEDQAPTPSPEPERRIVIENEIRELQAKAVQLSRAGKKPEALQIMAKIRRLKDLLSSIENGPQNLTETVSKPEAEISARSEKQDVILQDVLNRLQQATKAALQLKRDGDIKGARALMPTISLLKDAKSKLEKGEPFDKSSLPQTDVQNVLLPNKSELFDSLERDLKDQVVRVYEEAKQALKQDLKDEARAIMAIKVRTEKDLETVAQIRLKNGPLPNVIRTQRTVTYLRQFEHVGSNQLELEVIKAEQLSPPSGWKICTSFVSYEMNYPKDVVQKGVTQTVPDSDDPVFGFKKLLSFARPKRTPRMFNFVKLSFSVQVPRMILFKPIVIGTAELKLGDLVEKSQISAILQLKGGRGKLHVAVRLRNPLSGQDFAKRTVQDLSIQIIDNSPNPPMDDVQSRTHQAHPIEPQAAPRLSPKEPSRFPRSGHIPDGIDEADWNDPHRISSLRSNDVMQSVLDKLVQTIGIYRAKKLDPGPLLLQFQQVSALKQQLEQQVEEGTLTLPAYLDILRDDIRRLTLLQSELAKANRNDDAQMVLSRLKIEQDELNTALSADNSEP